VPASEVKLGLAVMPVLVRVKKEGRAEPDDKAPDRVIV
jgi:hypothetical protein